MVLSLLLLPILAKVVLMPMGNSIQLSVAFEGTSKCLEEVAVFSQIQKSNLIINAGVHDAVMGRATPVEFIVVMFPHVP